MTVSNIPPADPIPTPPGSADRQSYVEEVRTPTEVYQRQVVSNPSADRLQTLARANQIIWLFFVFVEALIGLRIVLKLIGAGTEAFFTQLVYGTSQVFLWPFSGITTNPGTGTYVLEISSIIAMLVYLLVAWGITRLVWAVFHRNSSTAETVYRQNRL